MFSSFLAFSASDVKPNMVAFGLLASLIILFALGVVFFPNAVRSALSLVATFFLLAVLYFTLGADLLGISQIVVYTGAIMVLFLFVIMLLKLGTTDALVEKFDPKKVIGGALGLGFIALVGTQVFAPLAGLNELTAPAGFGQPQAIGKALFTEYGYPFEAVSVLLMVGIVGSILLAKRRIR